MCSALTPLRVELKEMGLLGNADEPVSVQDEQSHPYVNESTAAPERGHQNGEFLEALSSGPRGQLPADPEHWRSVIDAAEKEVQVKVAENEYLHSRLRVAEWQLRNTKVPSASQLVPNGAASAHPAPVSSRLADVAPDQTRLPPSRFSTDLEQEAVDPLGRSQTQGMYEYGRNRLGRFQSGDGNFVDGASSADISPPSTPAPSQGGSRVWVRDLALGQQHGQRNLELALKERDRLLGQAHVREAELQRETRVLAARLAHMRVAYDEQQRKLAEAATKALASRADVLKENAHLHRLLAEAENAKSMYSTTLLPLLSNYGLTPDPNDTSAIANAVKQLIERLASEISLMEKMFSGIGSTSNLPYLTWTPPSPSTLAPPSPATEAGTFRRPGSPTDPGMARRPGSEAGASRRPSSNNGNYDADEAPPQRVATFGGEFGSLSGKLLKGSDVTGTDGTAKLELFPGGQWSPLSPLSPPRAGDLPKPPSLKIPPQLGPLQVEVPAPLNNVVTTSTAVVAQKVTEVVSLAHANAPSFAKREQSFLTASITGSVPAADATKEGTADEEPETDFPFPDIDTPSSRPETPQLGGVLKGGAGGGEQNSVGSRSRYERQRSVQFREDGGSEGGESLPPPPRAIKGHYRADSNKNLLDSVASDHVAPYGGQAEDEEAQVEAEEAGDSLTDMPAITNLKVMGDASLGGKLTACGHSQNGTNACYFQWVRHWPDGNAMYIEAARQPEYLISADDAECFITVECLPVDSQGRKGPLVSAAANEAKQIPLDESTLELLNSYRSQGKAYFDVRDYNDGAEHRLTLERKSFSIKRNKTLVIKEPYTPAVQVEIPVGLPTVLLLHISNSRRLDLDLKDNRSRDLCTLALRQFVEAYLQAVEEKGSKRKGFWSR